MIKKYFMILILGGYLNSLNGAYYNPEEGSYRCHGTHYAQMGRAKQQIQEHIIFPTLKDENLLDQVEKIQREKQAPLPGAILDAKESQEKLQEAAERLRDFAFQIETARSNLIDSISCLVEQAVTQLHKPSPQLIQEAQKGELTPSQLAQQTFNNRYKKRVLQYKQELQKITHNAAYDIPVAAEKTIWDDVVNPRLKQVIEKEKQEAACCTVQ